METSKEKLKEEILKGEHLVCLYAVDQPLVDLLCEIIRDSEKAHSFMTMENNKTI